MQRRRGRGGWGGRGGLRGEGLLGAAAGSEDSITRCNTVVKQVQ